MLLSAASASHYGGLKAERNCIEMRHGKYRCVRHRRVHIV
jgi:hypothetical protein